VNASGMNGSQTFNVGYAFAEVATAVGDFPSLISESYGLTYAAHWRLVYAFAKRMQALGVGRDSIVALNTGEKVVSISILLATALLGAQFVPTDSALAQQKPVRPTHFIKSVEAAGARAVPFITIDQTWMPDASTPAVPDPREFEGYASAEDPWLLLHTSGSTGEPKFLQLSPRIVYERTKAVRRDFNYAQSTVAILYGCSSRPFFARGLGVFLNACTLVDSADISFWRKTGVNFVCCSPIQAERWFNGTPPGKKLPRIEVAGGKLSEPLIRQILTVFDELHDVYGASETNKSFTNVTTVSPEGAIIRRGLPIETTTIEILDNTGGACGPSKIGVLRTCNTYLAPGYLNAPQATAKAFRDGKFYSGDLASWEANGELVIHGRDDDVFNIGGSKVNILLLDLVMQLVPGVKDAVCIKSPKPNREFELLALVVYADTAGRAEVEMRLRETCIEKLGLLLTPRHFHAIDRVPRSEDGLPQRRKCQQLILEASKKERKK
jgi:acyl-coenzyme A synthetase/AMP-(fatty) acid ligase